MKTIRERLSIVFCIRNLAGEVLEQNEASVSFCGKQVGMACSGGCTQIYSYNSRLPKRSHRRFLNQKIRGERLDFIHSVTESEQLSVLLPAEALSVRSAEMREALIHCPGLTKREREIARLMTLGFSNQEIGVLLFLATSTVKTHINRIYQKAERKLVRVERCRWRNI